MRKISLNGQWALFDIETGEKYVAQVPGDINYDMYVNKDMPSMYVDENYKLYRFAEKDFTYKKEFVFSKEDLVYEHVYLSLQGIDTYAEIYVNDNLVGKTDNAFIGYKFDIKEFAKEGTNVLTVKMFATMRYYNAANVDGYKALFTQKRILLRRPQCHYGWDWAPELVGYGIYQDVDIILQSDKRIENIYYLTENNGNLRIFANLENDSGYKAFTAEDSLLYELFYQGEKIISVKKTVEEIKNFVNVKVPDVKLWWPNGYGEQHLYQLTVSLCRNEEIIDQKSTNVGFRTVKVLEEAYSEDETTFAFEINGVKIYGKGSNWVPLDSCTGVITDEKYDKAVLLAKDANMNMLRVWGGGLYEKDVFYEACDKYGILVWQDCMISCAEIPEDIEEHRNAVMEEWKYNVLRLRNHPSLLCWTGGNEREKWDGNRKCKGDALVDVYLRGIVGAYDPKTPYFNQSPHGYNSKDNDLKSGDCHKSAFDMITTENIFGYREWLATFHTNFNSECTSLGPTVEKSYRKMFTPENQWPRTDMWVYRHSRNPYARVDVPFIEKIVRYGEAVYGKMESLSDFCKKGMLVHAKFFGSEIDYHRSSDRNAGVMNWMYSDIWPTGNWSLVDYYLERKAAYYAAKRSFEPITPIFAYEASGKTRLVVSNHTPKDVKVNLEYGAKHYDGTILWRKEEKDLLVASASNCKMDYLSATLEDGYYYAILTVGDKNVERIYQPKVWDVSTISAKYTFEIKEQKIVEKKWRTEVLIDADTYVQMLSIEYWGDEFIQVSDNYFDMQAKTKKTVAIYSERPLNITKIKILSFKEEC